MVKHYERICRINQAMRIYSQLLQHIYRDRLEKSVFYSRMRILLH